MAQLLRINLLPGAGRQAAMPKPEELLRMPLVRVGAGGFALVIALLGALVLVRGAQLSALRKQVAALEPKKAQMDQQQALLRQLQMQQHVFKSLQTDERYRWSLRLQELSTATPDGVWFNELEMDQGKGLIIKGSAVSEGGNQTGKVNELVERLREQPKFTGAVKDLQIESVKATEEGEFSLAQFTLTGSLPKGEAP